MVMTWILYGFYEERERERECVFKSVLGILLVLTYRKMLLAVSGRDDKIGQENP